LQVADDQFNQTYGIRFMKEYFNASGQDFECISRRDYSFANEALFNGLDDVEKLKSFHNLAK